MKRMILIAALLAAPAIAQQAMTPLMWREYVDDPARGMAFWICHYADGQQITVRSTATCPLQIPSYG